jgi:1-acyl-sn-glycerol-3-phosphate acyltransferase
MAMSNGWRHPGRTGAVLYAVAAAAVGVASTLVSRLAVARERGRRDIAHRLPDGPIIVIANHTSYADGVLLVLACRRLGRSLRLLAKSGVFRAPMFGGLLRRLGFIPVERGGADAARSLDAAADALAAGEAVGIFPEGRITRDPERWPERSKTGAVRLALRSGAPIVPVAMVGGHEVVGRQRIVPHLLRNLVMRPRVEVRIGQPIDVRPLVGWRSDPSPEAVRRAADLVMGELIGLVAEVRRLDPAYAVGAPRRDEPTR